MCSGVAVRWFSLAAVLAFPACTTARGPLAAEPQASKPPSLAPSAKPAPSALSKPAFTPGPLVVEPPFEGEAGGWAGSTLFLNLISSGWSRDSKLFACCHVAADTQRFTKACELFDRDHHVAQRVVSKLDYGAGQAHPRDPDLEGVLSPRGVPAPEGAWPHAGHLIATWMQPNEHEIRVSLHELSTGVEVPIANLSSTHSTLVPRRMVVSPDGQRLAIVAYLVRGPPLTTDAWLVESGPAAAEAYTAAANQLAARGDGAGAERLRARANAAR